jgi:hypothetical protein
VHRGNHVSAAFERNLRTIIRRHLRAKGPVMGIDEAAP